MGVIVQNARYRLVSGGVNARQPAQGEWLVRFRLPHYEARACKLRLTGLKGLAPLAPSSNSRAISSVRLLSSAESSPRAPSTDLISSRAWSRVSASGGS